MMVACVLQGQNKSGGGAAQIPWETGSVTSLRSSLREARDHINEFGMPNDGYDYSQHLREMGESWGADKADEARGGQQ